MNEITSNPDPEKRFQHLVRQLLMVENAVLQDPQRPFTQERLHDVLCEFCEIIADFIRAESCTIQLTLYDPGLTKVAGKIPANKLKEALDERCTNPNSEMERKQREKNYQSIATFPYWWSGKGLMRLVASNKTSAWYCALDPCHDHAFLHLTTGITTTIVQDKLPRVRNRWDIRGMRHWKKLGPADTTIWDNTKWTRIFRNYYGVPIQIHASGETIGLLKLENKQWEENTKMENHLERLFSKELGRNSQPILNDLIAAFPEGGDDPSQTCEPFSFLARAYLLMEIRSLWKNSSSGRLFDKYEPASSTVWFPTTGRAPVQIFTLETEHEETLLTLVNQDQAAPIRWDAGTIDLQEKPKLAAALSLLLALDQSLQSSLPTSGRRNAQEYANEIADRLKTALTRVLNGPETIDVRPWPRIENREAHFAYEITLRLPARGKEKKGENLTLISVVPPSTGELAELVRIWSTTSPLSAAFYERFLPGQPGAQEGRASWTVGRKDGEFAIIKGIGGQRDTVWVRDLWIDRMAARVQALVFAIPVPKFMPETDTRLLTWAAFEIGKLIERRIAYHANRGRDPMPLTSVEFFRIPISSACFVDDLKDRRIDAERAKNHLDHHIQNLVFASHLNDHHEFVRYRGRVKPYGSYLERLGERWDGHVRGSLAIYFLLLEKAFEAPHADPEPRVSGGDGFKKALNRFCIDLVECLKKLKLKENQREVVTQALAALEKDGLPQAMANWVGDVDFLTPPLPKTFPMAGPTLDTACQTLAENLECVGVGDLPKDAKIENWKTSGSFLNLVFRNYDPFLSHSASLLCQVLNRAADGNQQPKFSDFYRAAYQLKDLLSQSRPEMEGDDLVELHKFWKKQTSDDAPESAKKQTDNDDSGNNERPWAQLLEYVVSNETIDFMEHFRPEERAKDDADNTPAFLLPLTPTGVYKRIRMLTDILHRQRASAHLDWLTRRFDFLGCRLTCLYKNQVFAMYEQLWNQGDPFFLHNTETDDWEEFCAPDSAHDQIRKRTRWLCLRTNVHEDEYRALQIAALTDPVAIEGGHWDQPGYNLRRLKRALGILFKAYEGNLAEQYRGYAFIRNRFRREYLEWFRKADSKTRPDADGRAVEAARETDRDRPDFGTFLCEAVFNLILARSDAEGAKGMEEMVYPLSEALKDFLPAAARYTSDLLNQMELPSVDFEPDNNLLTTAGRLYDRAATELRLTDEEGKHLEKEMSRLLRPGADWRFPAIWVPPDRFKEWIDVLDVNPRDSGDAKAEQLLRLWEEIRREQKEFLFYRGEGTPKSPGMGLRWRERDWVMDRIMNYVLLYDPRSRSFPNKDFQGWTAYDLFYYVRSLVPVEIQIRTAFADTMAEQYHDAIYKGRPRKETESPRKRLGELSKRLADLDNEMEIDFEDFADRQMASEPDSGKS